MDLQTIILISGGVLSVTVIVLLSLILRKQYTTGLDGHHHTLNFEKKLEEVCNRNDNPFKNVDNWVVKLGDGLGRIYVVENKITGQHFLFSKDFSIAEWQK